MIRRPPIATRTDTLFPDTRRFRAGVDRAALALRRLGEADRILRVPAARFGLAAEHDATDALPFQAVLERTLGLQFAIGIAEDDIGSVSCNLDRKSTRLNSSH